jgi:hypothetical protein
MNTTRLYFQMNGLLALLVWGSNGVAQEWRPVVADNGAVLAQVGAPVPAALQPVAPAPTAVQPAAPVPAAIVPAAVQLAAPTPGVVKPAVQPVPTPAPTPMMLPPATPAPAVAPASTGGPDAGMPEFLNYLPHPPAHPTTLLQPATAQLYTCPSLATDPQYLDGDPRLNPGNGAQLGWYGSAELEIGAPHIFKNLANTVTAGSRAPDLVELPNRGLDATVAPVFELGYHMQDALGSFALSYRFLNSTGTSSTFGPDGVAGLQSRMDLNVIDLDYVSQVLFTHDVWQMRWRLGARLAYLYYDSVLNQTLAEATPGTGILQQQATNSYWGLGPHAAVELTRELGVPGLTLLGKLDVASLFGRIKQGESETALDAASASGVSFANTSLSSSQTCPTVSMNFGLNWQPPGHQEFNCFVGYQYEYWWNVGRLSVLGDSRGELQFQGLVARLQFNY